MNSGVVVIGGDYRALGVVRSLGRKGIPVWVLTNEHQLATVSRYAQRRLTWPGEEDRQVDYLLTLARRERLEGWVLIPSDDEAAAVLSRHHDALSELFRLTTPPWEIFRWCYDKRLTSQLALKLGIDHPRTFVPRGEFDLESIPCPFPVVLKPAFKESKNRFTTEKAWRADDRKTLAEAYRRAAQLVDPGIIMVQELIPGGGREQLSFAALCDEGEPVAWLTARRTRQNPIEFGRASSFVETIDAPEIEAPSRRLLEAIGMDGLVEVEYKRDSKSGRCLLLEINCRVWGWQSIGSAAGIDFASLLWKQANSEPMPRIRGRAGVRWIRMLTDIPVVIREISRRRLRLSEYLRSLRQPLEFAIFAGDDPLPALFDVPFLAWVAWKRNGHVSTGSPAKKLKTQFR